MRSLFDKALVHHYYIGESQRKKTIQMLEARLPEFNEERKRILNLMEKWDKQPATLSKTAKIINHTVRVLLGFGEPVPLAMILYSMRDTMLFSRAKNPSAFVSAILGTELRRKHPRIKRIGRGIYDLTDRQSGRVGRSQSYQSGKTGNAER